MDAGFVKVTAEFPPPIHADRVFKIQEYSVLLSPVLQ
jgi:hypothetical protein